MLSFYPFKSFANIVETVVTATIFTIPHTKLFFSILTALQPVPPSPTYQYNHNLSSDYQLQHYSSITMTKSTTRIMQSSSQTHCFLVIQLLPSYISTNRNHNHNHNHYNSSCYPKSKNCYSPPSPNKPHHQHKNYLHQAWPQPPKAGTVVLKFHYYIKLSPALSTGCSTRILSSGESASKGPTATKNGFYRILRGK